MHEVWKRVTDFPNYQVSSYGRVLNTERDRYLTHIANSRGHLRVTLWAEGVPQVVYLNHLVARTFFGEFEYDSRIQVKHVNGDINDNHVDNLMLYKGTVRPDRANRKSGWGKKVKILETGEIFRTVQDCARYIGGDHSKIYAVLRGERRHHLGFKFEYYEENQ